MDHATPHAPATETAPLRRTRNKTMPIAAVDAIYAALRKSGLPQGVLASQLGVNHTYLSKILHHKLPMARVYALAIKMILLQHKLGQIEPD